MGVGLRVTEVKGLQPIWRERMQTWDTQLEFRRAFGSRPLKIGGVDTLLNGVGGRDRNPKGRLCTETLPAQAAGK